MLKLIKYSEMVKKPWKNGLGITHEAAIYPPTAQFPADEFLWRISCAEINSSNLFSQFNDFDRQLVVWKGEGIILNGIRIKPLSPYQFRGEDITRCELINGEVIDLGVIYRRDLIECKMDVISLDMNHKNSVNSLRGHSNFIFCVEGLLNVHGFFLQEGDVLQMTGLVSAEITALSTSKYITIQINDVGS